MNKQEQEPIYRITYHSNGQVVELYARNVYQGGMFGFVEVEELLLDEPQSELLIDPEVERLQSEFAGVEITFIPLHSIIRIDQMRTAGRTKVSQSEAAQGHANVSYLPGMFPPHTHGQPDE